MGVASLLMGVLGSAPAPVPAPPHALEVQVETTASCLDATSLRVGVAEALGVPLTEGSHDATATVQTRSTEGGWHATIRVVHVDTVDAAVRELRVDNPACDELHAAVTLVTALLLDELWAQRSVVQVPVPDPTPTAEPPAPPLDEGPAQLGRVTSVLPGGRASFRLPWRVDSGVVGALGVGDLPRAAGGVGLRLEVEAPRLVSFGVKTLVWPRARALLDGRPAAQFFAVDGAVFVCGRGRAPRLHLGGCVGGRAGLGRARGLGFPENTASLRPRALADGDVFVRFVPRPALGVRVALGVSAPLIRDRFVVGQGGEDRVVHRPWPVVPTASIALELRSSVGTR